MSSRATLARQTWPLAMLPLPIVILSACLWITAPPPDLPSVRLPNEPQPPRVLCSYAQPTTISPAPRQPTRPLFTIPAHMMPMEYRGLEVLAAEELEYEGGSREVRCVLEGFLGQENVLVSFLSDMRGNPMVTSTASAERVSLFVPEPHLPSVQSGLVALGFGLTREKYGARTLQVKIPQTENFFAALEKLSSLLANRAEIVFCPTALPCTYPSP